MARGWESKSVESQMEAAEQAARVRPSTKATADQIERRQKRDSLLLSRARIVNDLASCRNPRYRTLLEKALAYLDEQLRLLD